MQDGRRTAERIWREIEYWMRHRLDDDRVASDDARRFEFRGERGKRHDRLRRNTRFGRRRDADPTVLDAEPGRVAMLDMLLRALDRRHENQGDGQNRDPGEDRPAQRLRGQVGHEERVHVLYRRQPRGAREESRHRCWRDAPDAVEAACCPAKIQYDSGLRRDVAGRTRPLDRTSPGPSTPNGLSDDRVGCVESSSRGTANRLAATPWAVHVLPIRRYKSAYCATSSSWPLASTHP